MKLVNSSFHANSIIETVILQCVCHLLLGKACKYLFFHNHDRVKKIEISLETIYSISHVMCRLLGEKEIIFK